MESDSSFEGEERNSGVSSRKWASRENSDVSDDENFSRGAKSIESPPESPPRGGGNLDSPPASPAPGVESPGGPRSPDSQSRSGRSSPYRESPSPQSNCDAPKSQSIGSPDDSSPESPRPGYDSEPSWSHRGVMSPCSLQDYPRSPSKDASPRSRSMSKSPGPGNPKTPPRKDHYKRQRSGSDSDDGRSNISSTSSIGSAASGKDAKNFTPADKKTTEKVEIKTHGEDLSDVSDIESLGYLSDNDCDNKSLSSKDEEDKQEKDKKMVLNNLTEDTEQLDFEAEEDREEGEVEGVKAPKNSNGALPSNESKGGSDDDGELKELEEGELTDEGENRPEETEPRPVCRFFSRGQCTWGSSCRFVHPGVTDKGNYTMFDMVRPLVAMNNGPPHVYPATPMAAPIDYHRPMERMMGPPPYQQPPVRKDDALGESAWERGLRQAKELIRKSSKRKETEVDFEEKKMNMSLAQDEFDKENDYYTRSGSPYMCEENYDKYKGDGKRYRSVSDRFADYGPPSGPYYRDVWHYDERSSRYSRHHQSDYHHRADSVGGSDDYYDRKRHKYPSREVIVQRMDKWKEDSSPTRSRERGGGRGDEWADPWMRSKSPSRKMSRSRKKSYSSRSSYSSSRSSSYSSYSRSRSISRSSRSSSRSRSRSAPRKKSPAHRRQRSPFARGKVSSPTYSSEKRAETERSLHMNPPAPSPRVTTSPARRNPTPPNERSNKGLSTRLLAAAIRDRSGSRSSRSSSGSESSGSSSDSSSDSASSSSSSRDASPPKPAAKTSSSRTKRTGLDEKAAQSMKVKAMDALKVSGQKQQIKVNLKGRDVSSSAGKSAPCKLPGPQQLEVFSDRPQVPVVSGSSSRKRPAESPPFGDSDSSPPLISSKSGKKPPPPSRREELLKQLKAVEDAIARKRSKI